MMVRGMTPKKNKILSVPLPPEDRIFLLPINLGVGWGGIKDGCCKERRRRKASLSLSLFTFSPFPKWKKGGGELSREAGDRRRMLCFFLFSAASSFVKLSFPKGGPTNFTREKCFEKDNFSRNNPDASLSPPQGCRDWVPAEKMIFFLFLSFPRQNRFFSVSLSTFPFPLLLLRAGYGKSLFSCVSLSTRKPKLFSPRKEGRKEHPMQDKEKRKGACRA